MLIAVFSLNALVLMGYALSLPNLFAKAAVLPSSAVSIIAWCGAAGFVQGLNDPVLFELGAELTYQKETATHGPEGMSAGLIVFVWNVASALTLLIAPSAEGARMINLVAPATFLSAALAVGCLVRERYGRQNAEEAPALSVQ